MIAPQQTTSASIIMAARNAERTIDKAIRSAMEQSHVSEIVVVDDASTDATRGIVRQLARLDARINLVALTTNVGPGEARNVGIANSTAPLIAVMDSDDFMLPGRMEKMISHFHDCDFLADDMLYCDEIGGPILESNIIDHREKLIDFASFVNGNITEHGRVRREMGFLKPIISRAFLAKSGLRYHPFLRLGEDYALYAEALLKGARFKLMEACGYVSLRRCDSISSRHTTSDLNALYEFDKALLTAATSTHQRAAIEAHMRDTRNRLDFRLLLDAKSQRNYAGALRIFLRTPRTAAYITRELARAKLGV